MRYQDMYWHLFAQSGDPEAYMAYRQSDTGEGQSRTGKAASSSLTAGPNENL